jgi:hypothetical protein
MGQVMADRDARHKLPAAIRLRAAIAMVRHAIANTKNPHLLFRYTGELAALQRRLAMVERGEKDAG